MVRSMWSKAAGRASTGNNTWGLLACTCRTTSSASVALQSKVTRVPYRPSSARAWSSAAAMNAGPPSPPATLRAASKDTAVTTEVAYRLNRTCTANRSSTRKTEKPIHIEIGPPPRSSISAPPGSPRLRARRPDLVDLVGGLAAGVAPDGLEAHPHHGAEGGHDQD